MIHPARTRVQLESHILERGKADRSSKAWRLAKLGWTVREIGERLEISKSQASEDLSENSHLGKIGQTLGADWNEKGIAEVANRLDLRLTDCYAAAMDAMNEPDPVSLSPYPHPGNVLQGILRGRIQRFQPQRHRGGNHPTCYPCVAPWAEYASPQRARASYRADGRGIILPLRPFVPDSHRSTTENPRIVDDVDQHLDLDLDDLLLDQRLDQHDTAHHGIDGVWTPRIGTGHPGRSGIPSARTRDTTINGYYPKWGVNGY